MYILHLAGFTLTDLCFLCAEIEGMYHLTQLQTHFVFKFYFVACTCVCTCKVEVRGRCQVCAFIDAPYRILCRRIFLRIFLAPEFFPSATYVVPLHSLFTVLGMKLNSLSLVWQVPYQWTSAQPTGF